MTVADNYTPTTQHVRAVWLDAYPDEFRGQGGAAFDRFIAALHAEWEAEQGETEPEGFYVIPNRDSPDQDSLWDGTIHPTWEAARASLDDAVREWGQDAENHHVVAMVPVDENGEN